MNILRKQAYMKKLWKSSDYIAYNINFNPDKIMFSLQKQSVSWERG